MAALQVTLSVGNKLYTSYNVVIRIMCVVIFTVTDELDVCFLQHEIFSNCNHAYKNYRLHHCIKKFVISIVCSNFLSCNSAFDSHNFDSA